MDKQAAVRVWFIATVGIFVVGAMYGVMMEPWDKIANYTQEHTVAGYEDTYNKITTAWEKWPILLIFGIIVSAIMYQSRSSNNQLPRF